jgi:hypothetical protein
VGNAVNPFHNTNENLWKNPEYIEYRPRNNAAVITERFNTPKVMSPGEVDALTIDLMNEIQVDQPFVDEFCKIANEFRRDWRQVWLQYSDMPQGYLHYQNLIHTAKRKLNSIKSPVRLRGNNINAVFIMNARIFIAALSVEQESKTSSGIDGNKNTPTQQGSFNLLEIEKNKHIGRNSPCPCGSGKKYKKCHGFR